MTLLNVYSLLKIFQPIAFFSKQNKVEDDFMIAAITMITKKP